MWSLNPKGGVVMDVFKKPDAIDEDVVKNLGYCVGAETISGHVLWKSFSYERSLQSKPA